MRGAEFKPAPVEVSFMLTLIAVVIIEAVSESRLFILEIWDTESCVET